MAPRATPTHDVSEWLVGNDLNESSFPGFRRDRAHHEPDRRDDASGLADDLSNIFRVDVNEESPGVALGILLDFDLIRVFDHGLDKMLDERCVVAHGLSFF